MDDSLRILGENFCTVVCTRGGKRYHHVISIRYQLAGLYGNGRQCGRPVARLRGADSIFS